MTGISCRSSDRKKPKKYHKKPKKTEKNRKKPKKPKKAEKNRKKPNATANFKFGTGFFRFFSVFFGFFWVATPPIIKVCKGANKGHLGGLDKVFKIRDHHHRIHRQILRPNEGLILILAQS